MEISFVNKNKAVQPRQTREATSDPVKNIDKDENNKYVQKNKVDRAEISGNHSGTFEDSRISVAKSSILYDVSVRTSDDRIQALKAAIEKGEYDVPANILAEEILK